jgi:hypothetical protein
MVLSPYSRWFAPLNMAIPPEFVVQSAHIYGDSVRNCSGSGGPRIVQRMHYYFCYVLGFLGISLNLGSKSSHTILEISKIVNSRST